MKTVDLRKLTAVVRVLRSRLAQHKRRIAKSSDDAGKEFWRGVYHGTSNSVELVESLITQEAGR